LIELSSYATKEDQANGRDRGIEESTTTPKQRRRPCNAEIINETDPMRVLPEGYPTDATFQEEGEEFESKGHQTTHRKLSISEIASAINMAHNGSLVFLVVD
jgi:hypothetical protein